MARARFPGSWVAVVAGACLWAGSVGASGVWNQRDGYYLDELDDTGGLELIQAVSVDASTADTSIGVTPNWIWAQPGPSGTYLTDTRFTGTGATTFVQVATATPYGEAIQLFRRFYSAANQMEWDNDCDGLSSQDPRCLVYPISAAGRERALGARSDQQVLLVPDVASFNRCQTDKTCKGSGDYVIASLIVYQDANRDFLLSGRPYNATWWLRSPGMHPNPPPTAAEYNDRLAGFVVSYSYTTNGSPRTDYFGGAAGGCLDVDTNIRCLERSRGCPLHVRLQDPPAEAFTATLYLNTPAKAPYTPYSFSFNPGSLRGAGSPWDSKDCEDDLLGGMNIGMCHDPPGGTWGFFLTTAGTSSPPNSNSASSSCGSPAVPCTNSRAAASLYIDGLTITAGEGVYLSPAFDSLSEKTQWLAVSWNSDLNPDAKGVRTPVQLDWRIANSTAGFGFSNTTFDTSLAPVLPAIEEDSGPIPGAPIMGRYFQYRALFSAWDQNAANPPPSKAPWPSDDGACARFNNMAYDGSLLPRVRQFRVVYGPDAGQFVSKPITPGRLWRWGRLTYRKDEPSSSRVVCDVLDPAGGILLSNVTSDASLADIDPGRYPAIRARFTLYRQGGGTSVDPRVHWFKVTYFPLQGCLALNRNTVRLSYGEDVAVRFCTNRSGMVDVTIHDAAGQLVRRLYHGELYAGDICQRRWNGMSDPGGRAASTCDASDTNTGGGVPVAPGLYFVTVMTTAGRETARVAVSR